ncbi:MAG TPA: arginine--tRNA ligase [Candidatus Paceibacterota bacterium]|nr:arginine--tRNA ligase [Candidatus Paceibacterota bacterium]
MKNRIKNLIKETLEKLEIKVESFNVEHPEIFDNGDYSTNVAMVCAKKMGVNPKELAERIVEKMKEDLLAEEKTFIEDIAVAGPGFINFYLSRGFFVEQVDEILKQKENWGKNRNLAGKKVMVEYTQPNPFKPFHIGHLMSNAIGESISRIVEFSGAKTVRANYQGDVGPHVAKAIYALLKFGMPEEYESITAKAQYIGELYAKGNELYETDEEAKKEIDEINRKVYDRSDEKINVTYDWGRKITLEAFEEIYKTLGTKFDKYYFESEVAPIGKEIVKNNIGKVFEESEGAVVFHAEKYDPKLHTRVFINSKDLPTYETKELGLTLTKFKKNIFSKKLDVSIVTTAVEQAEYMKVVQKAISLINPELESRMKHVTHGMMRLASGKMSSRKGNVITGESLLQDSMDVVLEKVRERDFSDQEKREIAKSVGVAALKYSILRPSLGSDIIYDFEKSISFEGDSGPYLQYTAVRASSILEKAKDFKNETLEKEKEIPEEITHLEKIIYQFPEVVERAHQEFAPHLITTYLTELASAFNSFYGNNHILDTENKFADFQLDLVKAFYQTMQNGLWLLGIKIPERM